MKVVLICPSERSALGPLAQAGPAVTCPMFGKSLLEHWLEHLVLAGVKEAVILASERPDDVAALVSDGSRWGLRAVIRPEVRELTVPEARAKYRPDTGQPAPACGDIIPLDHFPGLPEWPLFGSCANWFAAMQILLIRRMVPPLLGMREIQPGIWAGRRAHIATDAKLAAPCWIGQNAWIGSRAIIGPGCVVERRAFIAAKAELASSFVAPETYVGEATLVRDSLAWGRWLHNWRSNSCLQVPDPFLLCGLREPQPFFQEVTWPAQIASIFMLGLTLPFGLLSLLKSKLEETPAFRRLVIREEG